MSRLTPAALRSAVTDPRVQTTVRWSVVVPSQVSANGVVSAQPAATSIFAMSAGPVSAPEDDQAARAGLHPAHLGGVDDPDVAAAVRGQRDPGVGGNRGRGRHPGHDLERHPCLGARRCLGSGRGRTGTGRR